MVNTFKKSFALKNTYRANTILYAIKQIPLIKKLLPDNPYKVKGVKTFANIIAIIWECGDAFFGKLLYFIMLSLSAVNLFKTGSSSGVFLHMLVLLTLVGGLLNTDMFEPSRDKYYAIFSLKFDAKKYAVSNYFYELAKFAAAFTLFGIIFGMLSGLKLWQCLLIPLFVTGVKICAAAFTLIYYESAGKAPAQTVFGKLRWLIALLLAAAAYGLPALGLVIPQYISIAVMVVFIVLGAVLAGKILKFNNYREIYCDILNESVIDKNAVNVIKEQSYKSISTDGTIISSRKGFEYLNELFIRRHKKILWSASKKTALICAAVFAALIIAVIVVPEGKEAANKFLVSSLPWLLIIMYAINRGTGFTRALFINCDHSLLTYSFYKTPGHILKLFKIRLKEIIKINLLPAAVVGVGLEILLILSGGTDDFVNYAVVVIAPVALSIFFSVHYLTIYYLLQPYNAGTEIKSGMYQVIMYITYMVCYIMMQIKIPTLYFGLAAIAFCILYCIIAGVLVYKFAPRTFRIRA